MSPLVGADPVTPDTLLARIAATEAVARAAMENERSGEWEAYALPDPGATRWPMIGVGIAGDREMGHRTETMFPQDAAHIAAWDPVRVLAVCAGAKTLVEMCAPSECSGALTEDEADECMAGYGFRPPRHYPVDYAPGCDGCSAAEPADHDHARVLAAVAAMFAEPGEES